MMNLTVSVDDLRAMSQKLLLVLSLVFSGCNVANKGLEGQKRGSERPKKNDITEISLERSVCFGTCPAYKATFHKNGLASYEGESNTQLIGSYTADDSSCVKCYFDPLVRWLDMQDYHGDQPDGQAQVVDASKITITVVRGNSKETFVGYDSFSSPELWGIAIAIDGVISKINWKKAKQ